MFRRLARPAVVVAPNPDRPREIAHGRADTATHVSAIRRGWEAFNRRDFDGAVRYLHPEGEPSPLPVGVIAVAETAARCAGATR